MSHTPGPWSVTRELSTSNRWRIVVTHGTLARVYGHEADARLIAAAPDLLAAAKRLQGSAGNPQVDEEYAVHALGQDLIAIRAAIAKAEGRES